MTTPLFGYRGKKASDRLQAEQKAHREVTRAVAVAFKNPSTEKPATATTRSGRPPSIWLGSPAQEARKAAQARKAAEIQAQAEEQKAADTRKAEQVRKAAAAVQAQRVEAEQVIRRAVFNQSLKRELVIKTSIKKGDLTSTEVAVFGVLVNAYRNAGNRAVKLPASEAATALGLREAAVTSALDGLKRKALVIETVDTAGATKLLPAAHALVSVTVEEAA